MEANMEVADAPGGVPSLGPVGGRGDGCAGAPGPCRCAPRSSSWPSWSGWWPGSCWPPRARRAAAASPARPSRRSRALHAHAGQPGQHEHPRRDRRRHQRRVPGGRRQQPGRQARLRRGQGVQRADPGHPPLRRPDQQAGGINGRKINPIIVQFDPTNDANMQALCKHWTQGNPGVFAVLDGIGTWEGDNQLCVTQQGHTPLISAWSTVTNWTTSARPTCGGPGPTWRRSSTPPCSGA